MLVKQITQRSVFISRYHYNCVYEYTVDGETFKSKYTTYDYPSDTITLYYSKEKPGKAIARQEDMIGSYAAKMFTPIAIGAAVYGLLKLTIK